MVAGGLALLCLALPGATVVANECPAAGEWWLPDQQQIKGAGEMATVLERPDVVLLGEQHGRASHHRWQLHVLAGLRQQRPDLAIGLEMLPRTAQPALDQWVAGELDQQAFLQESGWHDHWGFDPDLYMPILHFARMHQVPLVALNVEGSLARRLAREGWDEVPEAERHGISPPASATAGYREHLEAIFERHPTEAIPGMEVADFVAGQLVWDRVMAHELAAQAERHDLVVGLMGSGHVIHGYGVPHQLEDLGMRNIISLLPWAVGGDCRALAADYADAVFALDEDERFEPQQLRLGVELIAAEEGVRVGHVAEASVAERAGLRVDDVIRQAAGKPVAQPADLVAIVRRQAPGTWLPLKVAREGETHELVARFPNS